MKFLWIQKNLSLLTWSVLALCLCGALIYVSQAVQVQSREIKKLERVIIAIQESHYVLEAEWAYLNRPERLDRLWHAFHKSVAEQDKTQKGLKILTEIPRHTIPVLPSHKPEKLVLVERKVL